MIDSLLSWLEHSANIFPLPLFSFIGSFLEELIAPIPSPLVMGTAGIILQANQSSLMYIMYIAAIGSVGKTIASVILYYFGDRVEDVLVKLVGPKLSFSGDNLEKYGKYFHNTKADGIILFVL